MEYGLMDPNNSWYHGPQGESAQQHEHMNTLTP